MDLVSGIDPPRSTLSAFVARAMESGTLVVQPRMGFSDPATMRSGLVATQSALGRTVGTITLDSYTRVGRHDLAFEALQRQMPLNGYPIVAHELETTARVLDDFEDQNFPVQVRHGTAKPGKIMNRMVELGLDATEGGPVSYCLPYGRTPLSVSVAHWRKGVEVLLEMRHLGREPHLETFGGCLLGQLCPPSLLIAMSVLEGMFFFELGIKELSLSFAQLPNASQNRAALRALHALADEYLPNAFVHIVLYTYMGVFPRTRIGSDRILIESAVLAASTGTERLIVKTEAESVRIPTIRENVRALELASQAAALVDHGGGVGSSGFGDVYWHTRDIIESVLTAASNIGDAIINAFKCGSLDVPYCLHPDNAGCTRSYMDLSGALYWTDSGGMAAPAGSAASSISSGRMNSTGLLKSLNFVRDKFDSSSSEQLVEVGLIDDLTYPVLRSLDLE